MKDKYIFGRGDSSGLLEMATIASILDDYAFFSFTTPRKLHSAISNLVKGDKGHIYMVGLAVNKGTRAKLFSEIEKRSGFTSHFFDRHDLPKGVSIQDLPFDEVFIDHLVSNCENAYIETGSELRTMIPAIASIHEGFTDTEIVESARLEYGDSLYKNADVLKLGLAVHNGDLKFKRKLINYFSMGQIPLTIPTLVFSYKQGVKQLDELKLIADRRKIDLDNVSYCFFHLEGNYSSMLADYLALSTEKSVGVSVIETHKNVQKINLSSTDPKLNLGVIIRKLAPSFGGFGNGSITGASATIATRSTSYFLDRLDAEIARYK